MSAPALTRPEEILRAFETRHPGIWKFFERCRADRDWPGWCYIPVAAAQAYIAHEFGVAGRDPLVLRALQDDPRFLIPAYDAGIAATLAAWRMGRGIYRFDPDFTAALTATPLSGNLPVDLLIHLPEWAVYVEMAAPPVQGFFASLEWDVNRAEAEMRLFWDCGDPAPMALPLPLTASTIAEMLESLRSRVRGNAVKMGLDASAWEAVYGADGSISGIVRDALPRALNLLLYLCSPEAEYQGGGRPSRPASVRTKRGPREFPASAPRVWRIGATIGERLRLAATQPSLAERNAPRPHLRRAHWHTYRTGKGRAGYRVRWLHPILVGYSNEEEEG